MSFSLIGGLFFYSFRMVRVQGSSMEPTYSNGQWLLVRRLNWPSPPPRVGDVVVFRMENDLLVKRVAAVGGQPIPGGRPILLLVPSRERPKAWEKAFVTASGPETVPPGQLYVLGDNPSVSDDSRMFGPVPLSVLIGRVIRWNEPGQAPPDE
jgi:signal peptidase I